MRFREHNRATSRICRELLHCLTVIEIKVITVNLFFFFFWQYCGACGLSRYLSAKESAWQHRKHKRPRFDPWVRKISWGRKWQPTPVFLPGKFHGQRSLVGYSPWGHKKLDMTEWMSMYTRWGMWDLVLRPRIELELPALEARSFNHWTAREVHHCDLIWYFPLVSIYFLFICLVYCIYFWNNFGCFPHFRHFDILWFYALASQLLPLSFPLFFLPSLPSSFFHFLGARQ